jgi:hypothetical protein
MGRPRSSLSSSIALNGISIHFCPRALPLSKLLHERERLAAARQLQCVTHLRVESPHAGAQRTAPLLMPQSLVAAKPPQSEEDLQREGNERERAPAQVGLSGIATSKAQNYKEHGGKSDLW